MATDVRQQILRSIPEKDFEKQVLDYAKLQGWKSVHIPKVLAVDPKTNLTVWRTPIKADGKGFPDWIFVRERVIFAELKTENGKLSPEQVEWYQVLENAKQEVYVWRPSHIDQIMKVMR